MPRYKISLRKTPGSGTRRVCPMGVGAGSLVIADGKPVEVTIEESQAREIATGFTWFEVKPLDDPPPPSPLDENKSRKKVTSPPKRKPKAKRSKTK